MVRASRYKTYWQKKVNQILSPNEGKTHNVDYLTHHTLPLILRHRWVLHLIEAESSLALRLRRRKAAISKNIERKKHAHGLGSRAHRSWALSQSTRENAFALRALQEFAALQRELQGTRTSDPKAQARICFLLWSNAPERGYMNALNKPRAGPKPRTPRCSGDTPHPKRAPPSFPSPPQAPRERSFVEGNGEFYGRALLPPSRQVQRHHLVSSQHS
jgi:hypothetical protein